MERRLPIYLRTLRRRWGLTQPELAQLLGIQRSHISRLESGKRTPAFESLIAILLVFETKASDVFPKMTKEIWEDVGRRAYELHSEVQGNSSRGTKMKLDFLERVIKRAKDQPNQVGA